MQDQRNQDAELQNVAEREQQTERVVLNFMFDESASWPWSVQEIARELGDEVDAEDAIARLVRTGLAHRLGEFVFPTRTARRAAEVQVGTI